MEEKEKIVKQIEKVISICNEFRFLQNTKKMADEVKAKLLSDEIILPLLGEFSCGKSSLMNAVLGSNVLPVDIPPTTATINEIRFSQDRNKIEIFSNGKKEIEGIINLGEFKDLSADLIKIYSSKTDVPKEIVFVDLPGLSSDIKKHEKILLDYLPKSDALLIFMDVNQGALTKPIEDVVKIIAPLHKKIFVIYTKSDTKSSQEIIALKSYAETDLTFKPERVVFTSAKTKEIKQFLDLIHHIYQLADEILLKNISTELSAICKEVISLINLQVESANLDDKEIELKIKTTTFEIEKLRNSIKSEIDTTKNRIRTVEDESVAIFEKIMRGEIDKLVDFAFKDADELQKRFDDTIMNAGQKAIQRYNEGLEGVIKQLSVDIEGIAKMVDVSPVVKHSIEGVIILIMFVVSAILIPGSAWLKEIGATISTRIATKFPFIKDIWAPIEGIIKKGIEFFTRNYVQKKIEEAVNNAVSQFKKELEGESERLITRIEEELWGRFNQSVSSLEETLEALREEKKKRLDEFNNYIMRLKNSRREIEEILNEN